MRPIDKLPVKSASWKLSVFIYLLIVSTCFVGACGSDTNAPTDPGIVNLDEDNPNRIENGIHVRTGFVDGEGLNLVIANCTNCHSAKLVTQNRMSRERWEATIDWMQKTQNLWDLGENEEAIVNYLATHYAPTSVGRRQNLKNIEWYDLKK